MSTRPILIALVATVLVGCHETGHPTSSAEAIIVVAIIAGLCFFSWLMFR